MSEKDEEQMVDPPDNQGGGSKAELDDSEADSAAVDPPTSDGGN